MDGSTESEQGVLNWCTMIRFTMAQDPGRAFLDQQVQQGFDFLDSYLDNIVYRQHEESIYDLLKTPGRRKAGQKRTRVNTTTAAKPDPHSVITLDDNVTEKENIVPVNNFHKALLEAKEKADSAQQQTMMAEEPHAPLEPDAAEEAPSTMQLDEPAESEVRAQQDIPGVREEVAVDDDGAEGSDMAFEEREPIVVKELSMIAEDDEERSRVSSRPPIFKDAMDITVPIRGTDAVPSVPTLARKPSMSQFAGLPAPSPLRKSMKLHREPSTNAVSTMSQTPGTGLTGGKRTSWLSRAKEVRALELSKKMDSAAELVVAFGMLDATKKRKSGDMLGPVDTIPDEDSERKQKSAKFLSAVTEPAGPPAASRSSTDALPTRSFLSQQKPAGVQPSTSDTFLDDFTVPLGDVSEDQDALGKLKRTVEGFGARTKSMGKSLGGNAAAALAEARAAAQARVAERNKEDGAEVAPDPTPAQPPKLPKEETAPKNAVHEQATERRMSISDLVSSAESKRDSKDSGSTKASDMSISTTPPDSPRQPTRFSEAAPAPPVFSKPPVFVAPPPVSSSHATGKDFVFKLPAGHPFAPPPAVLLGVNPSLPKAHPLSAQSSKASVLSDTIFDKEDDVPAWMPDTQDTEYSVNPSQDPQGKADDMLDEGDSWQVDDKFEPSQGWTPFNLAATERDETWTTTTASRSTSQKGGDTDRFQTASLTEALRPVVSDHRTGGSVDVLPGGTTTGVQQEADIAEISMDIDEDDSPAVDSELEEIALAGKSTINIVQQSYDNPRSQSQQSMASTSSSQSQQLGFFGQATKLMSSVLGGGKKTKPEPVKSIQRAAVVAKKQQEEAEKKAARLKDMEQRRQQALQRKAEEEKLRVEEEEKKLKDEAERRKKERDDLTDKRPLRSTAKKPTEDDTTKKRKLTVEPEKKPEPTKKPPSRDQPSRLGKAPTVPIKIGPPLKSAMKQTAQSSLVAGSSMLKEPTPAKTVKPVASSSTLKSTTSAKGKGKAELLDDMDQQPSQVIQAQMANRAKAQMQAAQTPQPPRVASESIELPEINSEYSDSEDEDRPKKFNPPSWAQSPELRQALEQQSTMNPDEIFGRIGPLRMEEIFRTRTSRFRARTSSANWSGVDQLTAEEEKAYEKRMGYR